MIVNKKDAGVRGLVRLSYDHAPADFFARRCSRLNGHLLGVSRLDHCCDAVAGLRHCSEESDAEEAGTKQCCLNEPSQITFHLGVLQSH